jgi:hypothetical protein
MNMTEAMLESAKAAFRPVPFNLKDRVRIIKGDYRGSKGVVVDFKTNMFGAPLVMVRVHQRPISCYAHELAFDTD